ncbi:MAG TPA: hypothetical protein VKE96_09995 [Vicinamibacterales bacterium]|nr:hypothetical protein [Vicinamibacterales bacterium]
MTKATRTDLVFLAAAVVLSLHTVPYELRVCIPPPDHGLDSPESLVAGTASTPYQYRVLVPLMVRGLLFAHVVDANTQMIAFAVIQVVALVLLALVFRAYLSRFVPDSVVCSTAALTLFAVLPFNYFNLPYYPYDIPSVLFFTLGLPLIYDRKWRWFYPLFVAATINRETSIFLTVVTVFVLFDRVSPRVLALLAGSQIAIWTAIKAALWVIYADNRWMGYGLYQFQLKVNLATLVERPLKAVIALATWGCLWMAVVIWHKRIRDPFLRRTLWTVPVFIAGMFFVGFIIELRIYGEVLPIVLAAFWVVFLDVIDGASRRRLAGFGGQTTASA